MKLFESKNTKQRLTEDDKATFKAKYLEGLQDMFMLKPNDKVDDGHTVAECVDVITNFVTSKGAGNWNGLNIDDAILYLNRAIQKKAGGNKDFQEAQRTVRTVLSLTRIKGNIPR